MTRSLPPVHIKLAVHRGLLDPVQPVLFLLIPHLTHQVLMKYLASCVHEPLCVSCVEPFELIDKATHGNYLLDVLSGLPSTGFCLYPPNPLHDLTSCLLHLNKRHQL